MAEIQQNRWDRIIRRVTGSVGTRSHVSESLSELFPVIDVERVPGELLVLGGTRLAHGGAVLVASPGNRGKIQLFNPAESNHLVTVTRILIRSAVTGALRVAMDAAARTNDSTAARYRDTRLGITQLPVAKVRSENTATAIAGIVQLFTIADVQLDIRDENGVAVLAPGTGISFGPDLINTAVSGSFFWREREALPSELQF